MNTTLKKKIAALPLLVATGVLVMSGCAETDTSPASPPKTSQTTKPSDAGSEVVEAAEEDAIYVGGPDAFLRVIPGDSPRLEMWGMGGDELLYVRFTCNGGHEAVVDSVVDPGMEERYDLDVPRSDEYTVTWLGPNPIGKGRTSDITVSNIPNGHGQRVLVPSDGGDDEMAYTFAGLRLGVFTTMCEEAGETPADFTTTDPDDKE